MTTAHCSLHCCWLSVPGTCSLSSVKRLIIGYSSIVLVLVSCDVLRWPDQNSFLARRAIHVNQPASCSSSKSRTKIKVWKLQRAPTFEHIKTSQLQFAEAEIFLCESSNTSNFVAHSFVPTKLLDLPNRAPASSLQRPRFLDRSHVGKSIWWRYLWCR